MILIYLYTPLFYHKTKPVDIISGYERFNELFFAFGQVNKDYSAGY